MTWVWAAVSMGSNLGDRWAHLKKAAQALTKLPHCRFFRFSSVYQTAAVDCPEPIPYYNAAVIFNTCTPPKTLLHQLQDIEKAHLRERSYRNAPRTLDLDLIYYGSLSIDEPELCLPHPRAHLRRFVMEPLAEIIEETHDFGDNEPANLLNSLKIQEIEKVATLNLNTVT